jgi:MOSC domain-containing protein YiiM
MIEISPKPIILTGKISNLGSSNRRSAIQKVQRSGPWKITFLGIEGDEQANTKHHGGIEKAIHHYPYDHYKYWLNTLGPHALLNQPGAFGENISTIGWTEETICIGDILAFGSAQLQVSQGRQPCLNLNLRFNLTEMAYLVQSSGLTGWYYRIITPGIVNTEARIQIVERRYPDWPLSRLNRLLYRDTLNREALEEMSKLKELSESWRNLVLQRLKKGKVEGWKRRLFGQRKRESSKLDNKN